jgi:hypothetical protein
MSLLSKSLIATAIVMSLSATSTAFAEECVLPNSPIIPDGNVASKDELVSAQGSFKAFESKIVDYRECLVAQEEKIPADSETLKAQKEAIIALDSASIDNLNKVADEFNAAVRAFKER